jgi:hypothetical protein
MKMSWRNSLAEVVSKGEISPFVLKLISKKFYQGVQKISKSKRGKDAPVVKVVEILIFNLALAAEELVLHRFLTPLFNSLQYVPCAKVLGKLPEA